MTRRRPQGTWLATALVALVWATAGMACERTDKDAREVRGTLVSIQALPGAANPDGVAHILYGFETVEWGTVAVSIPEGVTVGPMGSQVTLVAAPSGAVVEIVPGDGRRIPVPKQIP